MRVYNGVEFIQMIGNLGYMPFMPAYKIEILSLGIGDVKYLTGSFHPSVIDFSCIKRK